jgi:hypothetical protein
MKPHSECVSFPKSIGFARKTRKTVDFELANSNQLEKVTKITLEAIAN